MTTTHTPGELIEATRQATWGRGRGGQSPICNPGAPKIVRFPLASDSAARGWVPREGEGPGVAIEPSANLGSQSREGAEGGLSGNGEGPWGPWQSDWAKWFLCLTPAPSPCLQRSPTPSAVQAGGSAVVWARSTDRGHPLELAPSPGPHGLASAPSPALQTRQYLQIFFVFINIVQL